MEALYAKLYEKYNSLKKRKLSELDGINKDQEVKFMNYISAAEELIGYLKDQNESLKLEVSDLRSELASIRSSKDDEIAECQKLLSEENQKSKRLGEEIETLQKLQEMHSCRLEGSENDNTQLLVVDQSTPAFQSTKTMTSKHSQDASVVKESIRAPQQGNLNGSVARESVMLSEGTAPIRDSSNQQAECCGTIPKSGVSSLDDNYQIHALLEYLVGMKLCTRSQTEGVCISALHQSSGYSFSLTWLEKVDGEEPELLYRVVTLGTFETVAPEWMRSVLKFSLSMCPIFFERISNVIKLRRW